MIKITRIVMIGNFEPSHSTENDYAWSYLDCGFEVIKIQENKTTTDQILEICKRSKPQLVHYVHTHGWETPGTISLTELWDKLRELNITIISVHLDYWRGLEREKDVGTHPFWHTDFVFTADGGSNKWYRSKGINHFYLKAGVVKRDCYIGNKQKKYEHDVVFVGSKGYHREWDYRPRLIEWLHKTYGDRFAHYGNDGIKVVRGKELNDLYASAKVVVGDSLCLNFSHPEYFSDRLFETTGRGGFLIFPYIKGLEKCFKFWDELIIYRFGNLTDNVLGLKECIDYFLEHENERIEIQKASHLRTCRDHTYNNRIYEIIDVLMNAKNKT